MPNDAKPAALNSPLKHHVPAVALLLVWLGLAVHTACSMSVTHDEIWHLPVGVRNLQGDFAADRLNPPLCRLWAALPLWLGGAEVPPSTNGPATGETFVAAHPGFINWYILGRIFHLVWTLGTAALVYAWLLHLGGIWPARIGLLSFLCCPDITAHSALVTPDAAALFGFLATSWALWYWLGDPARWQRTVLLGVALGMLQATKFTGVVFYPVVAGCVVWACLRPASRGVGPLLHGGLAFVISLCVLASSFGLQGGGVSLKDYAFLSTDLKTLQQLLKGIPYVPVPVPRDYLLGLDEQRSIMEHAHPVFLDGVWSLTGFRHYYLMSMLYKLPHALQLLALAGVWFAARRLDRTLLVAVGLPVALLFGIASLSGMQLGQRYVLPVIPVLAIAAGFSVDLWRRCSINVRQVSGVLVLLLLLSPWRFHPFHLAYFNEWAGGPVGGRWHLIDSNLDWGQDLQRAADVIRAQTDRQPTFVYFGTVDPRRVGIHAPLPPSRQPEPGLHVVSVNFVMGRPHAVWQPDGTRRSLDINEFGYFRFFEPVQTLGGSIDVYDLSADDVARYHRAVR